MATVVARNRYKLLRLATAQPPENSQREQPTLAERGNRLSSARVSLGRMEHEETRLDPDKVRRVEFFHQPPGRQLVLPAPSVLGCPPALSLAGGSSQPLPTFIAAFPSPCGGWMWGMPLKQHTSCWGPKNSLFTRQILGGTLFGTCRHFIGG